jgi:hypothetical protein
VSHLFTPAGLLGAASGIALALYLFSLIQKRAIRAFDPAASIEEGGHGPLSARVTPANDLLALVFVVEWGVVAIFVLSELLPGGYQTALKSMAISSGGSIAILYVLCIIRLRSLGLINPPKPAKPPRNRPRRPRRLRGRIRAHD